MSYTDLIAYFQTQLKAMPQIAVVLDYEPQQIAKAPCAYTLYDSGTMVNVGQRRGQRTRTVVRVVIARQHAPEAERLLNELVYAVPNALEANRYAGGAIDGGSVAMSDQNAGYLDFGGTSYRVLDTVMEALDKRVIPDA